MSPDADVERIRTHYPAHRARWETFRREGTLLAIGTYEDARDGALALFTERAAAEQFARQDPFVLNGVVGSWDILAWNELLLDERA